MGDKKHQESWGEELNNILEKYNTYETLKDVLSDYIKDLLQREREKVLDVIASGEGWEDTRDKYALKLELRPKYMMTSDNYKNAIGIND